MKSTSALATRLELVYPPFTNQEAEWLARDPDTVARWQRGSLYMIGGRAEATFANISLTRPRGSTLDVIDGTLVAGGIIDSFEVHLDDLLIYHRTTLGADDVVRVTGGPRAFFIEAGTTAEHDEGSARIIDFFTAEKLIYNASSKHPAIRGLSRVDEYASYELLYVGLAGGSDVYERLLKGAHHARQKILSNEYPRSPGARVSDEIVFFVFAPAHFAIRLLDEDSALSNPTAADAERRRRAVVADAEKAFIKLLDPTYNVQKYPRYPKGVDGLYGHGLSGYGYVINENLELRTSTATFRGATHVVRYEGRVERLPDNDGDFIVVHGDEVILHKGSDQ